MGRERKASWMFPSSHCKKFCDSFLKVRCFILLVLSLKCCRAEKNKEKRPEEGFWSLDGARVIRFQEVAAQADFMEQVLRCLGPKERVNIEWVSSDWERWAGASWKDYRRFNLDHFLNVCSFLYTENFSVHLKQFI